MTLLADLLCGGGKPRLRGQDPTPPLAVPVCDPTMHLPSHWDPAFPWILQMLFPRCGEVWRRRETSGKGSMPRPRPLQPPCVTPRCICQTTGIPPLHGFCKYLSLPFPRRGAVWRRRETSGRGQCPSPLSACFPLKYSGGATGSPAVIDVADMAVPTPVRTPTGCAGCRTSVRRCPRIFVPAGGGGSSWWGSAPRSRCSRGS